MAVKKTASTGKSSAAAKTAAKKTAAKKPDAAKSTKAVKKPVVAPADPKVFISNDDAYWFGNDRWAYFSNMENVYTYKPWGRTAGAIYRFP